MKYIAIISFCFFLMSQQSCKKFLEETSPSIVIPKEPSHYLELLNGEGYPNYTNDGFQIFSELLTDNVQWGHIVNLNPLYGAPKEFKTKNGWGVYMFIDDPESVSGNGTDNYWGNLYRSITVCNMVLSGIANTSDADRELKTKVKGQAYALRALNYLSLMNLYGMPYKKGQDSEYGVPLKTSSIAEDRAYRRNSVHEVYNRIKTDIDSALVLLDPSENIKLYSMNWYAAMILATRIHLYMENYDEVIRIGEMYLKRKSEMAVTTQTLTNGNFMGFTAAWSGVCLNPEVVFNYGTGPATFNGVYQGSTSADYFTVSQDLRSLYAKSLKAGQSDMRMSNPAGTVASWFFGVGSSLYVPRKIYNFNTRNKVLRTSEVLLNLAEAYWYKDNLPQALSHLNTLRAARIRPYTNLLLDEFDRAALETFIAEERRRELCFEEHRLPDLKRYGMPAMTKHVEDFSGKYKVEIAEGDMGYILQIPLKERSVNAEIQLIPRPQRNIVAY